MTQGSQNAGRSTVAASDAERGDALVDRLVMVEPDGVLRPVGDHAVAQMRRGAGRSFAVLGSPPHVLVMGSDDGPGVLLAGELASASRIHDICAMIAHSRWRGQLAVAADDAIRRLFISDGYVVGATSSAGPERLGEVLMHFGAMDEHQLAQTIDICRDGLRFGDAAVELGFLSREELYRYLVKQTELIAYAAVSIQRGSFVFLDDFDDERITFPLSLPITELLMEGVRRMDEMEFFRSRVPSTAHVPVVAKDDPPKEDDPTFVVWAAIDGVRTVDEVARAAGLELFDAMRGVYELVKRGRVTVREPSQGGIGGVVEIFNEAIRLIMSEVDKYPGASGDIRESLASFAASGEVYEPIFRGAGPADDGTLDVARVVDNLVQASSDDRELAEWLYEYASFAMFIAEPVLRAGARSDAAGVSSRVSDLLAPLAPEL